VSVRGRDFSRSTTTSSSALLLRGCRNSSISLRRDGTGWGCGRRRIRFRSIVRPCARRTPRIPRRHRGRRTRTTSRIERHNLFGLERDTSFAAPSHRGHHSHYAFVTRATALGRRSAPQASAAGSHARERQGTHCGLSASEGRPHVWQLILPRRLRARLRRLEGRQALRPPSMANVCEVIIALSSAARYRTACAISSGVVWRPSGMSPSKILAASSRGLPVARISMSS
jgi:hypothetical protein